MMIEQGNAVLLEQRTQTIHLARYSRLGDAKELLGNARGEAAGLHGVDGRQCLHQSLRRTAGL